jgi:hypothetical protein
MRRLGIFVSGCLVFWLAVALPARHVWGDSAAVFSGVAILLCLIPTAATFVWAQWALAHSPEQQLWMVLGGTGIRMFFVLTGGGLLYWLVPYFQQSQSFWIWILISYLFTLSLEMALVVSQKHSPTGVGESFASTGIRQSETSVEIESSDGKRF